MRVADGDTDDASGSDRRGHEAFAASLAHVAARGAVKRSSGQLAKGVGIAASEYRSIGVSEYLQSVPEESSVRVLEAMLGCMAHLKDRYA